MVNSEQRGAYLGSESVLDAVVHAVSWQTLTTIASREL